MLIPSESTQPLYLAFSVLETLLLPAVADCVEAVKLFATIEQVNIISRLLQLLGPSNASDTTRVEFQACLYDPRAYSWRILKEENSYEAVFLRPILLRVLALSISADHAYRKYDTPETTVPPLPCTPVPPSKSPCEEPALIVCKYSTDTVFAILSSHTLFKALSSHLVAVPVPNMEVYSPEKAILQSPLRLEESVLVAALEYVTAIGSTGVIGLAAALEAIAEAGFKTTQTSTNVYSLSSLQQYMESVGPTGIQRDGGYTWVRPKVFDDVFSAQDTGVISAISDVATKPILWPFITLSSSIISILADPKSTRPSAELAVEAMIKLSKYDIQHAHSQPVLGDILSAVFLSIGGGVALTGLLGRFGNVSVDFSDTVTSYAKYLFQRGVERQTFWHEWNVAHKEVVVLDPKTGKPIHKKDDKKVKETKTEKKVDPKAIPPVVIVPEIHWNIESTDEHPDPNHGPSEVLIEA